MNATIRFASFAMALALFSAASVSADGFSSSGPDVSSSAEEEPAAKKPFPSKADFEAELEEIDRTKTGQERYEAYKKAYEERNRRIAEYLSDPEADPDLVEELSAEKRDNEKDLDEMGPYDESVWSSVDDESDEDGPGEDPSATGADDLDDDGDPVVEDDYEVPDGTPPEGREMSEGDAKAALSSAVSQVDAIEGKQTTWDAMDVLLSQLEGTSRPTRTETKTVTETVARKRKKHSGYEYYTVTKTVQVEVPLPDTLDDLLAYSPPAEETEESPTTSEEPFPDEVTFSDLNWSYGGFDGASAEVSDVSIGGLVVDGRGLRFEYETDLSSWGLSHSDAGALACLFVQKEDGTWVGGKFDWISSSRKTRGFENIYGGYNGWNLSNVPAGANVAFCIVSRDGKKRSNIVTAKWER